MPKLMIVDDELDVREYLKNFFRRRKIDVITAESGEEALELIGKNKPDLILLDVRMAGINGIETLQKIREQGNQVKVIMVTGVEDQEMLKPLADLNVAACIHKPLILEELEREVFQRLV
ncbi:MAG TPA: two-component system response regulator [Candidatus Omnitrophica bacterium]|nr:two-component system response regulator [Candidatus Omnitrophota bacterium]